MILRHIGNNKKRTRERLKKEVCFLYRILKDPCGGKVFPSRSDFKHCRQMFSSQKEIMRRVGFTDEVKKNKNLSLSDKKCSK